VLVAWTISRVNKGCRVASVRALCADWVEKRARAASARGDIYQYIGAKDLCTVLIQFSAFPRRFPGGVYFRSVHHDLRFKYRNKRCGVTKGQVICMAAVKTDKNKRLPSFVEETPPE
jgi:hypothetical protein